MIPLYNHVLMAPPATGDNLQPLQKEILSFLWTKTENAETIQKKVISGMETAVSQFWHGWPVNSIS
jgi:hypothetical protein